MKPKTNQSTLQKLNFNLPSGYEFYCPNKTMSFMLTPTKTIVHIGINGAFLIRYDHRNHSKQLERLRGLIRQNKVKTASELIDYCDLRNGVYVDQMYGLELVPTKIERHI